MELTIHSLFVFSAHGTLQLTAGSTKMELTLTQDEVDAFRQAATNLFLNRQAEIAHDIAAATPLALPSA